MPLIDELAVKMSDFPIWKFFFFLLDTLRETVYLFLTNDKRAFQLFNRKTFLLFYRLAQHFITFIFHVKTLCVCLQRVKKKLDTVMTFVGGWCTVCRGMNSAVTQPRRCYNHLTTVAPSTPKCNHIFPPFLVCCWRLSCLPTFSTFSNLGLLARPAQLFLSFSYCVS